MGVDQRIQKHDCDTGVPPVLVAREVVQLTFPRYFQFQRITHGRDGRVTRCL